MSAPTLNNKFEIEQIFRIKGRKLHSFSQSSYKKMWKLEKLPIGITNIFSFLKKNPKIAMENEIYNI